MNQGRIWCVVNPTVGLPLLLGSVAITSLIVHACVLTNTTWYGALYQGGKGKTASTEGAAPAVASTATAPGFVVTMAPSTATAGAFTVTVTPTAAVTADVGAVRTEPLALASVAAK